MLFTVYSLPNIIVPLFGGIMLDKIGVRKSLVIFCTILTLGQFVFCLGGQLQSYKIMVIGRAIFGLGGENMGVGQSVIVSQWFKGGELNVAFGVIASVCSLGIVGNALIEP